MCSKASAERAHTGVPPTFISQTRGPRNFLHPRKSEKVKHHFPARCDPYLGTIGCGIVVVVVFLFFFLSGRPLMKLTARPLGPEHSIEAARHRYSTHLCRARFFTPFKRFPPTGARRIVSSGQKVISFLSTTGHFSLLL